MTAVGQPWKMPGTQSVGRTLQAEGGPLAARFGHCYSFTHESLPLPKKRRGIDPFTKVEREFAAKPASVRIKVRALKKLKDAAL